MTTQSASIPRTIYEDTNPKKLGSLLYEIDNGMTVLPDFQRDFVWEPGMVRGLLVSIASRYPAGSLLRVRNTKQYFAWRRFEAAPVSAGAPTFLVLDGQQRLTSLYQAFYGLGDYRFYLKLDLLSSGGEIEDAIFYEKVGSKIEKKYREFSTQAAELVLPLKVLRAQHANVTSWIMGVSKQMAANDVNKLFETQAKLQAVAEQWLRPIEDYEFPVVTLSDETEADAICTIFETLNRTGVKLSVFELLTARFYPTKLNLRDSWAKAFVENGIFEDFAVDPYQLLQALMLRVSDADPNRSITCKKGEILKLTRADIDLHWPSIVEGLAKGLELLRDDCGVVSGQWLPYSPMLVPLMAILAKHPLDSSADSGVRRSKLVRWFWCSSLSARYESAANTRSEEDYDQLSTWLKGGALPEAVVHFTIDNMHLIDVTPRQRARYRALMCLALRSNPTGKKDRARDFNSGAIIDAALIRHEDIDDHHIFPVSYLKKNPQPKAEAVDCILNRTLIDADTNRHRVSDRAPSDYLGEVRDELAKANLSIETLLRSHMIDGSSIAAVWKDDFSAFLVERETSFKLAIAEVVG